MRNRQDDPPPRPQGRYRHDDAATDAALDWFLRRREPVGAADQAAFQRWLEADPRHGAAYARVETLWSLPELRRATRAGTAPPAANRNRAPRRLARIAAVLVLGLGVWQAPGAWLHLTADAATGPGEMAVQQLADGSTVRLNTDTLLRLDMRGPQRHVTLLQGEAFFDVAPDAARPFVVSAAHGAVTVTGTAFNVRIEDDGDHVLLARGTVRLSRPGAAAEVTLTPGEGAVIGADGISAPRSSDLGQGLGWLDGRVDIADQTLAAAVAGLGRYMRRPVILLPGAPAGARVSGSFRSQDPEAAIRALAAAAGAKVRALPGLLAVY